MNVQRFYKQEENFNFLQCSIYLHWSSLLKNKSHFWHWAWGNLLLNLDTNNNYLIFIATTRKANYWTMSVWAGPLRSVEFLWVPMDPSRLEGLISYQYDTWLTDLHCLSSPQHTQLNHPCDSRAQLMASRVIVCKLIELIIYIPEKEQNKFHVVVHYCIMIVRHSVVLL